MSLTRVGEHEFVWTYCFLSRGACLPRSKLLPDIPGSECDFLKHFLFRQFSAVCWIGYGSLSSGLSSCPAKSSEHIRRHGHNELLHHTNCADVPRGNVDSPSFVGFPLEAVERLGLATPLP